MSAPPSVPESSGVVSLSANSFRVQFRGRLCSPEWTQRGPAAAYLAGLISGARKPEYALKDAPDTARRSASLVPKAALREVFNQLCMHEGLPPFDGSGNICAGDGLFNANLERKLQALGISRRQAELESGFDAYRSVVRQHTASMVLLHAEFLHRLR